MSYTGVVVAPRADIVPASPPARGRRWTYAEYAKLPNDGRVYQILEGELVVSPAPNTLHQMVVVAFVATLVPHVRRGRLGRVLAAPVDVLLGKYSVVQPDVLFVARRRAAVVRRPNVRGAPTLAIEVVSPSSQRTDRVRKLSLYARFALPHFWLVDPAEKWLQEFVLVRGAYRIRTSIAGDDAVFAPALFPGLRIRLGDLWE